MKTKFFYWPTVNTKKLMKISAHDRKKLDKQHRKINNAHLAKMNTAAATIIFDLEEKGYDPESEVSKALFEDAFSVARNLIEEERVKAVKLMHKANNVILLRTDLEGEEKEAQDKFVDSIRKESGIIL